MGQQQSELDQEKYWLIYEFKGTLNWGRGLWGLRLGLYGPQILVCILFY